MPDKHKVRLPECIDCFAKIEDESKKSILGLEVRADAVLRSVKDKSELSIKESSDKITLMGANFDHKVVQMTGYFDSKIVAWSDDFSVFLTSSHLHLEKQSLKYDDFEKKVLGLIWKIMSFIFAIIVLCSGVVAFTWIAIQQKADKDEVFLWKDAKELQEVTHNYNEGRYVIRANSTTESTYLYIWSVKKMFKINNDK